MSDDADEGGEAPCLLPLFDREAVVADLDGLAAAALATGGAGGAVWSLPHDGDLDANLVVLPGDGSIGAHVNREVDVLLVVRTGSMALTIDGATVELAAGSLALVPRDRVRSIAAGDAGAEYLSIHRRRGGLRIS